MMAGYVQNRNPSPTLSQELEPLSFLATKIPPYSFHTEYFIVSWLFMLLRVTSLGQGLNFFPLQDISPCGSVLQLSGLVRYPAERPCVPQVCWCVRRGIPGHAQPVSPAMLRGRVWPSAPFQASFLPLSTSFCFSQWLPCCYVISLSFCFPSPGLASKPYVAEGTAPTDFLWFYLSFMYLLWKWWAQTFLCVTSLQNLRTWITGWEPFMHSSINYLTRTERC